MPDLPVIEAPLPVSPAAPRERSDAMRNRGRILAAAERLFASRGVETTSMDSIAAAAGVGKGTLFRRFGDRSSLVLAVLDRSEREFQDAFLRGPPPLGPGAPPAERLIAFGRAMLERLERHGQLLAAIERAEAGQWQRSAPYGVLWLHVRTLLEQASLGSEAEYLADVLMAALSPSVFHHQRHVRALAPEALQRSFVALVARLLGEAGGARQPRSRSGGANVERESRRAYPSSTASRRASRKRPGPQ
jgi:AcrR family transcriptional regulator